MPNDEDVQLDDDVSADTGADADIEAELDDDPQVDNDSDEDNGAASAAGAAPGDESAAGSTEGGSGSAPGAQASNADAAKPTGKALLDLLAGDTEAQQLMAMTLQEMMQERARSEAAAQEAKEFQELIEKGDYAEVGRRVYERAQAAQLREQITDQVLQEIFRPVYAELLSQPEFQNLTAEEREALDPKKFASDAHYVRALTEFRDAKRFEKAVEAEVERRLKAQREAAANRDVGAKVRTKSVAASPAGAPSSGLSTRSTDRIARGLRQLFGAQDDDDDE